MHLPLIVNIEPQTLTGLCSLGSSQPLAACFNKTLLFWLSRLGTDICLWLIPRPLPTSWGEQPNRSSQRCYVDFLAKQKDFWEPLWPQIKILLVLQVRVPTNIPLGLAGSTSFAIFPLSHLGLQAGVPTWALVLSRSCSWIIQDTCFLNGLESPMI